jgi:hypothetical protein
MKMLFATCSIAALAILATGCGGQGPHGPPKVQSAQPTEGSASAVHAPNQLRMWALQGPHGPPRIVQRPSVQTEPELNENILDSANISVAVRDCKIRHLSNYRVTEKKWRNTNNKLDVNELKKLEAWLDIIIYNVYDDNIDQPSATLPPLPALPDKAEFPTDCPAWEPWPPA